MHSRYFCSASSSPLLLRGKIYTNSSVRQSC